MKREIKFRVYCTETNKMITEKGYINMNGEGQLGVFEEESGEWFDNQECHKLMQFTGLLDKNGVEIYEGDIVNMFSGGIANIEYKDGGFKYRIENDYRPLMKTIANHTEVIGNIHQNPELLNTNTQNTSQQ